MRGSVFVGKPAANGVFEGFGLLVDFLEHVVLEIALLRVAWVPVDLMNRGVDAGVIGVEDVPVVGTQDAHLPVLQIDDFLGAAHQSARVAGDKVFVGADADDERAAEAGADEQVGLAGAHDGEAVGSFQ